MTSSALNNITGVKDERLVSICQALNISHYLSPVGSANYLEKETPGGAIVKAGIQLTYQNFIHPEYQQLYGSFQSHLTIIDMLFNCGSDNTLELIRSNSDRSKLL